MIPRTSSWLCRKICRLQFKTVEEKLHGNVRRISGKSWSSIEPELDFAYLTNPGNREEIESNITNRKGVGKIDEVIKFYEQYKAESNASKKQKLLEDLHTAASFIPNRTHPDVLQMRDIPRRIKLIENFDIKFRAKTFEDLAHNLGMLRLAELTNLTGPRSYYLVGDLAELEHALWRYTLSVLLRKKFNFILVPDILPASIIEGCGMKTRGERTQVFRLDNKHGTDMCLSGTAEMALASLYMNKTIDVNDLPIYLTSVSRCFRAEVSSIKIEKGIFRVHAFTKVEMFAITHPDDSDDRHKEFIDIQEEIFQSLGFDYQILDMPMEELGAQAYRKFDIEAWLPGSQMYGEVSSCSNCTDYQARRLGIRYREKDGKVGFAHTINGTACAVPRTIIAILESLQRENGSIKIPEPLVTYFNGRDEIRKDVPVSVERVQSESRSIQ